MRVRTGANLGVVVAESTLELLRLGLVELGFGHDVLRDDLVRSEWRWRPSPNERQIAPGHLREDGTQAGRLVACLLSSID